MKLVLQRVSTASVLVDQALVAQIGPGLLVLVGFGRDDGQAQLPALLDRLLACRLFSDPEGKMNLSLAQTGGGLLLVPNFTLLADTRKGTRPGFGGAAPPDQAAALFSALCASAAARVPQFGAGIFGADMQVQLVNDGPVTLLLEG